jgi:hypothetical protein
MAKKSSRKRKTGAVKAGSALSVGIGSDVATRNLHTMSNKLRESSTERQKFVANPVEYLRGAGISVPREFEVNLRNQAFSIETVLGGMHNPVAAIAVA